MPPGRRVPLIVLSGCWTLIGVHVYTQVLESDAGAAHHISFTEGLDLLLGT